MPKPKFQEYAVYKGEEFICIGNVEECAASLGVDPQTIRFYSSPSYLKKAELRNKKDIPIVLKLND